MSKKAPSLVAEDVTLTRDTRRILDGVSLAVQPGRFLAVIGPNGAGKSSLLSLMSGLWKPDTGRVVLDDRDIGTYRPAERARRCAVMRQDNARPAGMTVLEAVALGRMARGTQQRAGAPARPVLLHTSDPDEVIPI